MYTSNIFANCVNFDAYSSWQSKGILSEIIAGSNFVIWMITASLQYLQVSACYIIVNAHVYFCMEICLQLILLFLCRRRVDTKAKYACYTSSRSFSS